jgi:RES domain-containing protein
MPVDITIHYPGAHRLIPAKYAGPPSVLENLDLPANVLEDLSVLDAATNHRLGAEQGENPAIPPLELVSRVPEAAIINAAFTHCSPYGGRFNDTRRGAWYAGREIETSLYEVAFHKQQFLRDMGPVPPRSYDYQDFEADFLGIYCELTEYERQTCLQSDPIPQCYGPGQALAQTLLAEGKAGLVYPSVRYPAGDCLACFRPALVLNPRRGSQYQIRMGSETRWTLADVEQIPA